MGSKSSLLNGLRKEVCYHWQIWTFARCKNRDRTPLHSWYCEFDWSPQKSNPKSMVLNLDQTLVKYVPYSETTLTKQNTSSVSVIGVSDKPMITATFTITLDWKFLPMQLIYGGNTRKNIPTVKLPRGFFIMCKSEALQQ